jgi:NDP-sugar pyrophosphorylase family protein
MIVVIPIAGLSSRFYNYGFKTIKYNLPMNTQLDTMLYKSIETLNVPEGTTFIFITRFDNIHIKPFRKYKYIFKKIDYVTDGPASTVNLIRDFIDDDEPIIITNCDQVLDYNFDEFIKSSKGVGTVMTYKPNYKLILGSQDKHSFIDSTKNPPKFTEKIVISEDALTGVHYFSKGIYFKMGYDKMIELNLKAPNGEYYISLVYEALSILGYNTGIYRLSETENFYPVGEPNDYFDYLYNISDYKNIIFDVYDGYKFGESPITIEEGLSYSKIENLSEYTRGWLIGDFEPSIIRTTYYELGIMKYVKNSYHQFHIHQECDEYNYLIKGEIKINNFVIKAGQVFIIPKGQIVCPIFMKDCEIIVVKTPSKPTDKILF